MSPDIHNFRVTVSPWVLLGVLLVSIAVASMGDALTTAGLPVLLVAFLTRALGPMLTAAAAVMVTPVAAQPTPPAPPAP